MPLMDGLKESWYYGNAKWYLLGGLAGAGFIFWYRRHQKGQTSTTVDGDIATTEFGGLNSTPPVAGGSGGGSGGTTTGGATGYPQDNATWLQQAVARLQNPPYNADPVAVYNALTKALNGDQVTGLEANLVSWAISVFGTPPGGAPVINLAPSTPPPSTTTTTPPPVTSGSTPASKYPGGAHDVQTGQTLTSIAAAWGISAQTLYNNNKPQIEAAAKAHGKASSENGHWIYAGTRLYKP